MTTGDRPRRLLDKATGVEIRRRVAIKPESRRDDS